jgi:hypothetical protein
MQHLDQAIGDATGVESILQRAVAVVVHRGFLRAGPCRSRPA